MQLPSGMLEAGGIFYENAPLFGFRKAGPENKN
jgi:hypothetical protein